MGGAQGFAVFAEHHLWHRVKRTGLHQAVRVEQISLAPIEQVGDQQVEAHPVKVLPPSRGRHSARPPSPTAP